MNEQKKRLSVVFIVAAVILCVIIAAVLSQFIWNLRFSPVRVKCMSWDGAYEGLLYKAERYNKNELDSSETAYSFTGTLPSENPQDHMTVNLFFDVKNTSFLEKYYLDATLSTAEQYKENILFVTNANNVVTPTLFRNASAQGCVMLDIYKGNLSEEDIKALIRDLTITVTADGFLFGSQEKELDFRNCDSILFDTME